MNYLQIYEDIINNAELEKRKKKQGIYYENHHILPVSLGGENEKENLIFLTGKEHFICHKLLVEIFPEENSLKYALWMMMNVKNIGERNYKVGSREYERLRIIYSLIAVKDNSGIGNPMYGKKHKKKSIEKMSKSRPSIKGINNPNFGKKRSQYVKDRVSKANTGRIVSQETKDKLSKANIGKKRSKESIERYRKANLGKKNSMYGKDFSKEHREKIGKAVTGEKNGFYGKSHSEKTKQKIREKAKERNKIKVVCPHCNRKGGVSAMKQWHFDNCKFKKS